MKEKHPIVPLKYIWGPYVDFWLLGGASILLWGLLLVADPFKDSSITVHTRFGQIGIVLSFLSLFCNYPHFIISYRFGYGRGLKFIFGHWPALLAVPLVMTGFFSVAYLFFSFDFGGSALAARLDSWARIFGIDAGMRDRGALGREILSLSIWLMYFTVGWHYSKQVFGGMMVYAKLRGYKFSSTARHVIKGNLYTIALYQFLYLNALIGSSNGGTNYDPRFPGVVISAIPFPSWVQPLSTAALILSTGCVGWIFLHTFRKAKQMPDARFLVCWVSLLIWWIPVKQLPEFYAMAVPFFHSLQYLLFATKLEGSRLSRNSRGVGMVFWRVLMVILMGIAGFELIPALLDERLGTSLNQSAWFFMSVTAVFLNVHHFFIDSVVWKFNQKEIQAAFFD